MIDFEKYLIPAEEGLIFNDYREERIGLLKKKKSLIVITTSRDEYGGIDPTIYMKKYGFSNVVCFKMRMEEDPTVDDESIASDLIKIFDKSKDGKWIADTLYDYLDKYSKNTNTLVVIVYDYANYYKEPQTQKHPTIVVNSSRIITTAKELIGEHHSLKQINEKYKAHYYLSTKIDHKLFVKNPEKLNLFHVSIFRLKKLTPRVTIKPMDHENFGIARISAAPDIDSCFRGVGAVGALRRDLTDPIRGKDILKDSEGYFYRTYYCYNLFITSGTRVVKPTKKMVPDVEESGEYWVLDPVFVKELGFIKVKTKDGNEVIFEDRVKKE